MENEEDSISGNDTARPWQSYHTVYTNAKAGMEGVDKEKVQRIVYEMSKGSKYFENEERKEAYMKQKIENMRVQLAKLTPSDIASYQKIADERLVDLEATRDLSRIWLHVDMDAFYAAVETLSNPSLEGKPMAVGSLSMISTANYEARKFGVRAAMPGFIARKLCPDLIFVPTDFKKYTYYSDLTRKVFQKYDPNFFAASLDEAYLDITNFCSDRGLTGGQVAEELRESVHSETGLTCSAGVAPNRLLAKVCSDINKPNGQFLLPNNCMAVMAFISSLPIRKIGGIGKVTENILKDVLGITTCKEMLQKSGLIFALFSRSSADFFLSVGLGLGRTDTPQFLRRKSMSTERTFPSTKDETSLYQKLVDLAENLSADLKKEGLCGKTLTLKLKTSCFEVRTRAVTLPRYIFSSEDILKHAMMLLKAELPASLRLMGLRMSQFTEDGKCVSVDPKQKTLSTFIVTDDAMGRNLRDQKLSQFNLKDDTSSIGRGTSFSNDTSSCESMDLSNVHQVQNLGHPDSKKGQVVVEDGESLDLQIHCSRQNADDLSTEHGAIKMVPTGAARDSPSMKYEDSCLERQRRVIGCSDDEPVSLHDNKPFLWLNDYICSICGIELPPCFIDERQEHFDFHLAERLQEEESSSVLRIPTPRKRLIHEDHKVIHRQQKKKSKASPSKVDLAENLSADLKKEGLCGKTLTLKLKTSCFEVRTRAVTLPRHIFSSEDILKRAMMLLKAELPASLRLMGLRMSQFTEDGKCVSVDPKQKTLSTFIVTDDAMGRNLRDQKLSQFNLKDDTSSIGRGTGFSNDTSLCESMDLSNVHQVQNLGHPDSKKGQVVVEDGESLDLQIHCSRQNTDDLSTEHGAIKMVPTGAARDSPSMKYEDSCLERQRRVIGCSDDEPVSLHDNKPFLWLNDYICSICGIELPPTFIDERQEHFDFHLAERLQEEESSSVLRIPTPRKRLIHEDHKAIHRQQKKKSKASPSKGTHVPIDMFFVKTSQNL